MTDTSKVTAGEAVTSLPDAPAQKPSLIERLRDRERWKKSMMDVVLWFMGGVLLTTIISNFAPGRPIVVGSNSIPMGVYWLDMRVTSFHTNDYVSFPFKPAQEWLRTRYGTDRVFTKQVKGEAGDTVYSDDQQNLKICHQAPQGEQPSCESLGVAQKVDSLGRELTAWVPANHQYTLREGELWAWGSNPRSLDSRYYGPIRTAAVQGKATPLYTWE